MYVAGHFAMTDEQIASVLQELGQADLVTQHARGLAATPLPLLWQPSQTGHGALLGHVARNNRQWSEPSTGEALVIAHVTDHYVSPAWLPSTAEHGRVVPTWDYVTVHAYGTLIAHDDPAWTRDVVRRLTEHHERRRVAAAGGAGEAGEPVWSMDDAPADHVERMLRAIVGIEIRLTRWEAKAKMAQNKAPQDVAALAHVLDTGGDEVGGRWLRDVSLPAAERRAATVADLRNRRS